MKASLIRLIVGVLALLVIIPTPIYPQSTPPPSDQGQGEFALL
jgi:hypothetical protein